MNLKKLRIENNLTQKDLAKKFNITQGTYSNYENGTTQPDLQLLIDLAAFYHVTVDYLLGLNNSNEYSYLNDDEKEIISAFREMKPNNKSLLLSEAKVILKTQK